MQYSMLIKHKTKQFKGILQKDKKKKNEITTTHDRNATLDHSDGGCGA
jgi:hypothetical protein